MPKDKKDATDNTSKDSIKDVTEPGKAAADASSRPLIVGRKTLRLDPMVRNDDSSGEDGEKIVVKNKSAPELSSFQGKTLSPAGNQEKPKPEPKREDNPEPKAAKEPPKDEPPKPEEAKPTSDASKDQDVAAPEKDFKEQAPQDETSDKPSAEDTAATDKQKESKQEKERQERLEQLVKDRKYFVRIGEAKRRSAKRVALSIVLIILIGVAAVVFMAAAGVIDVDIGSFLEAVV